MAKESVTHRIAMRMDFRHDDEMGCVLEVDTDEKGRFIVHFPEAQVWKLLTELVQVEGQWKIRDNRKRSFEFEEKWKPWQL